MLWVYQMEGFFLHHHKTTKEILNNVTWFASCFWFTRNFRISCELFVFIDVSARQKQRREREINKTSESFAGAAIVLLLEWLVHRGEYNPMQQSRHER